MLSLTLIRQLVVRQRGFLEAIPARLPLLRGDVAALDQCIDTNNLILEEIDAQISRIPIKVISRTKRENIVGEPGVRVRPSGSSDTELR